MADSIYEFVGWWVTIGDAISGGSANQILFGDASTNVAQSPDLFFDATQKIFRVWDVSWTSNWVTFVLDDTIPAIKSMFADGIGTFEISWTGGNRLFLATASNWSFQAWDVDLASWGALLLVNSTFWEVKNVWDYYRFSPTGALFDYLFEINSSAKTTKIWDVAGIANSTLLTVDDTNSRITVSKPFWLKGYTVATLPIWFTGATAYVTDALAPAFGSTVVWWWAVVIKVFYNGSNRIVW